MAVNLNRQSCSNHGSLHCFETLVHCDNLYFIYSSTVEHYGVLYTRIDSIHVYIYKDQVYPCIYIYIHKDRFYPCIYNIQASSLSMYIYIKRSILSLYIHTYYKLQKNSGNRLQSQLDSHTHVYNGWPTCCVCVSTAVCTQVIEG